MAPEHPIRITLREIRDLCEAESGLGACFSDLLIDLAQVARGLPPRRAPNIEDEEGATVEKASGQLAPFRTSGSIPNSPRQVHPRLPKSPPLVSAAPSLERVSLPAPPLL